MCGIVAIVSKTSTFYHETTEIFEELLYADGIRGMDSTGVFSVTKKNQVNVLKQAVDPGIFLNTPQFASFKKHLGNSTIVVGHNRKATTGDIVSKNAHPFLSKNIVLVHNGYIGNYREMDASAAVDSASIVTALTTEPDYKKVIEGLSGAFALVWYNHEKKKLFFVRNSERPLFVCHTDTHLYIASEGRMIEWILSRHKISFNLTEEVKEGVLYTVTLDPYKIEREDVKLKSNAMWFPNSNEYVEGDAVTWALAHAANREADAEFVLEEPEASHMDAIADRPVEPADSNNTVASLMKCYPANSEVLFSPTGFTRLDAFTQVNGIMWTPGTASQLASVIVSEKHDEEDYLNFGPVPLLATVQHLSRRGQMYKFILNNLHKAELTGKEWNNKVLSITEYKMICKNLLCDECAGNLNPLCIDLTAITRLGKVQTGYNGKYSTLCDSCIEKKYSKDKSDPLKGSTHGS